MHRIFVSATTRDLKSYRLLASTSLRKRGYDVDDQAIFNLSYRKLVENDAQRIAACDAVVCLIGFAYGHEPQERPPDQHRRSFTQLECLFARERNKPVYLLLADEKTPFDPDPAEPESAELRRLQIDYRAEVISDHDWRAFASVDQLRAELAELRFPWEGPPPEYKPSNLPMVTLGSLFKGRETFLDELREGLTAPSGGATAIVSRQAIHGLGGVGKTRAAVEYAWRFAADYSALLFVSAPTPAELRTNLANLVSVLEMKVESVGADQLLAEVVRWLDAHPGWLLILDNVDSDEAAREVERLLAKLRAGHVLITSRIGNWSAGVDSLELHVLAPAAAVEFLLERTPHRRHATDDPTRAAAIAHELDGLALALEQVGAYIDKLRLSFVEYLQRWEAKRPDVLRWHDPRLMQYPASVAVTWETTFAQLTAPEQRLLEVLAWLAPEPIPLFLFDAKPLVEAIPEPREVLAGLAGYSLARFDPTGDAVLVHRLVQEITRERGRGTERDLALQTALDAVNGAAPLNSNDVRTWHVWTPLAPHAAAVTRYADAAGMTAPTSRLMNQLGLYFATRCQFGEAERLYRRELAIDEALHGPDHPEVAIDLNNLAELLRASNRLAEAEPIYRRTLAIDEAAAGPTHPDVAISLNNLAALLQDINRSEEAEPLYRRALGIDEAAYGLDHPSVAIRLNNLAGLLGATDRAHEAEPLCRRALAITEAAYGPSHPRVAIPLNNLAQFLRAANHLNEAELLYGRALAIDEAAYGPDHPRVATSLNNLAGVLQSGIRLGVAEALYRRALTINEAAYGPDHPGVATSLNNLALVLRATSRLDEAEPLYRRALEIFLRSGGDTGHEHPHLRGTIENYRILLAAMGQNLDQISGRLEEIGRPFGISLGYGA